MNDQSTIEQQLMRLIVLSSKAMGNGLATIEEALVNDVLTTDEQWQEVKNYVNQAHEVQTELITKEVRGEGVEVSLLAVHAQDHFMNSHFLSQIGEILIQQQQHIKALEERISQLEKVGE